MHECSSGPSILVNAEIDSMDGVLDCGAGTDSKASPRRAAIVKAHSELRQEFDVRDERRRELDFLEKGGNPLDFKLGQAASVSVQSTSHTDQHPEQIVSSVAKGNIPPSTSSLGDSIESSERPATVFEPTSADNLLLFDLEDDLVGKERSSAHQNERNDISTFEKSSQREGSKKTKELEDLGNFRPYARRNRSKSNRDGARSNSTDGIPPRAGLWSSLPARHSFKDTKGVKLETNNQKDQSKSSLANPKYGSSNGDLAVVGILSDTRIEAELNGLQECSADMINNGALKGVIDVTFAKDIKENEQLNVHTPAIILDRDNMIQPDNISKNEQLVSASVQCSTLHVTSSNGNTNTSGEPKKVSSSQRDWDGVQDEVQTSGGAFTAKIIDSGSSCTQSSISLVNESDMCNSTGNVDKNAKDMDNVLVLEEAHNPVSGTMVKEYKETNRVDSGLITNDDYDSSHQNHGGDESLVKKEMHTIDSGLQSAVDFSSKMEGLETTDPAEPDNNSEPDREISSTVRHQDTIRSSICEPNVNNSEPDREISSGLDAVNVPDIQTHDYQPKLSDKAHEDFILEEARSIEAKRKRIAELSVHTVLLEKSRKSHWDFVLEEMAWLANDVAQERLWKMAAASNISSQVALTSRSRLAEQKLFRNQKKVAFTMAKAVMHFWQSLQELVNSENPSEATDEKELQHGESSVTVKGYALRFLKYTRTGFPCTQAEAPLSPDSTSSLGVQESLNVEEFMEESLIYLVSFSAMETYRKSIESCLVQLKKTESSAMEEEVDTSMYDVVEDLSQGNTYDEEEGETSMYYNPGSVEESKPSKFSLKKRKNLIMACDGRSYEPEADFSNGQCTRGSNQPILVRKRPATNLNDGCIPTKRVRTASRQRFQNSFSAGAAGSLQAPNRTDGSSGDTNSFQDDQSTFHSEPQLHKCMEVESSATDFEKTLPYDGDMSDKPKKKKKAKHLNSTYDGRWQPDSVNHNEQRVNMKKRLERHLLDSNGSGLIAKKPKMKHSLDNTFDSSFPRNGSIPSSVASQMSNMSNSNKFMKLIGGRDRGRKSKSMKISAGQTGSGNPWSLFEDQALVVLVHDMGPNWELVSDAFNSTLQFKCIIRKAIECKERHKNLMDRTGGDGADSAEDSGSSQPYPSTLPGIPKGSARQLFQRLQGPMEEDTLKSHFEKIILIGQRQHYQTIQRDNQEMKQIAPVHNSHAMALSQVCPNNLSGGFLTPLDLCDVSGMSPDVIPHGYQGSQSSGLPITNQGSVSPLLASGANLSLHGSSNMVMGSNMSSPSSSTNASIRDGRYVVPRTSPIDEQQRLQQYNSMTSGRNIQQSSIPVSGALSGTDRGARVLPGGNGMGMIGGKNGALPVSRPGFQGNPSPSMLNNGSMLSSSMAGMPIPGTMHHGASSLSRPRETMHIMRPSQTQEHKKQMMLPQHHLQVSPGNNQGVTPLNGPNSSFSNQTASPTPTYPMRSSQQHQVSAPQPHVLQNSPHSHLQGSNPSTGMRHPAYTQLKEGQLHQQRLMQQRHQQYNFNGQPHMQPQVSSSTSQQASHPSSTPSSPQTSMSLQLQQKQNPPPQGFGRNPQTGAIGLNNQMLKQRQRLAQQQQFQQTSRQHPPHRQQMQSQQQAKLLKGMGRGNVLKNQSLSSDLSQSNGPCTSPVSQPGGKGEHVVHSTQGEGMNSGSIRSSVQPPRPEMPLQSSNQTQLQQHLSACSPSLSKQFNQVPTHSDNNSSQGLAQSSFGSHGHDSHQGAPASVSDSNHHHHQVHRQQPKIQAQPGGQRLLHLNRHGSSELTSDSLVYQPHVDQHVVNNTSDIDTTASMSQFNMKQTSVTPANYSSRASPWRACEPVHDASMQRPASPLDSVGGSLPRSNSVRPINLVQRQFSGGSVAQHQLEHQEKSQEHIPDYQAPRDESEQHIQHLESG